jgi:hypothetical protein
MIKVFCILGRVKGIEKTVTLLRGYHCWRAKWNIRTINANYRKIANIWKKGEGIVVLQVFSDSDHYISLCRENAMIKSVGKSLTNLINGSV